MSTSKVRENYSADAELRIYSNLVRGVADLILCFCYEDKSVQTFHLIKVAAHDEYTFICFLSRVHEDPREDNPLLMGRDNERHANI